MNWLIIFLVFVALGVVTDTFRLMLAWLLHFDVTAYSLFAGPKLFSFKGLGTTFSLRLLPLGASVSFNGDTYYQHPLFLRLIVTYLPELMIFSGIIWYILHSPDPSFAMAGKLFIGINIFIKIVSFLFKRLLSPSHT